MVIFHLKHKPTAREVTVQHNFLSWQIHPCDKKFYFQINIKHFFLSVTHDSSFLLMDPEQLSAQKRHSAQWKGRHFTSGGLQTNWSHLGLSSRTFPILTDLGWIQINTQNPFVQICSNYLSNFKLFIIIGRRMHPLILDIKKT